MNKMNKTGLKILFVALAISFSASCQNHFFWSHTPIEIIPPVEDGCYGYLYNAYALGDSRKLTSSDDWVYITDTDRNVLIDYVGGDTVAGGKLKDTGTDTWNSPNTGATNEYGFTMRGSGTRDGISGAFNNLKNIGYIRGKAGTGYNMAMIANYNQSSMFKAGTIGTKNGAPTRLVSDATGIPDGTQTTYTGNDGKIYPAIAINGKYWLQQNLEETEYRNGDPIPNVTDNTAWSNLTTGAWCVYNNNDDYKCK